MPNPKMIPVPILIPTFYLFFSRSDGVPVGIQFAWDSSGNPIPMGIPIPMHTFNAYPYYSEIFIWNRILQRIYLYIVI